MGTEVTESGVQKIRDLLGEKEGELAKALQNNLDPGHFCRTAMTMIMQNGDLLACSPVSLYNALLQAAQLSLNCDGLLGQAYLVPYGGKAVLVIGYKGLRELALRTGRYRDVRARVVFEKDVFEISLGTNEFVNHIPAEDDRGKMRGCYAVAVLADGSSVSEFMWAKEIEKHKEQYSKGWRKKDSMWQTATEVAWQKTLIRRLCGRLQMSVKTQAIMGLEDRMDVGLPIAESNFEGIIDVVPPQEDDKKPGAKPTLEETLAAKTKPVSGPAGEPPIHSALCDNIEEFLLTKYPDDGHKQEDVFQETATEVLGPPVDDLHVFESLSAEGLQRVLDALKKKG